MVAAEQDVGGLDVAVDQPGRVRGVERARDLVDDLAPRASGRAGPRRAAAGAGRCPPPSASRGTAARPPRPPRRRGSRSGDRSPPPSATRAGSARGSRRRRRARARSASARPAARARAAWRGRRCPCRRGRRPTRSGSPRYERLRGRRSRHSIVTNARAGGSSRRLALPRCTSVDRERIRPISSASWRSRRSRSRASRASRWTRPRRWSRRCCARPARPRSSASTCPARRRALRRLPRRRARRCCSTRTTTSSPRRPTGGTTDPFTPTLQDGRLYGRGAADDKSGIVAHLAALRALDGTPPVHVKVLDRGLGGERPPDAAAGRRREPELLRADVMVIADNGNWKVGEPTLSQTLRGHGKLTVTLRTLERRPAQRPLRRRRAGRAARADPPDRHAARRRRQRRRRGPRRTATGTAPSWPPRPTSAARPACSTACSWSARATSATACGRATRSRVLGLDAPAVEGAGNIVIPQRPRQGRRARPAGRRPGGARWTAVERHLRAHAPWGAQARDRGRAGVDPDRAAGARRRAERALERAFGKPVAAMGSGGSVPLVAKLRERLPGRGVRALGRPGLRPRPDPRRQRVRRDLDEIERIALAEALLLRALGSGR